MDRDESSSPCSQRTHSWFELFKGRGQMENSKARDDASGHLIFIDDKEFKHCCFSHCKKYGTSQKSQDYGCRFDVFTLGTPIQKCQVFKIEV